jgi:hypothetical protein
VSDLVSGTYGYLLANYGPLLTLKHVAELMHTTPNGVRMAIVRRRQPFAVALAGAQRRLGRRIYFEARRVASVIDHEATGERALLTDSPAAEGSASVRQETSGPSGATGTRRCTELGHSCLPQTQAMAR